jgi:hypothetical protein
MVAKKKERRSTMRQHHGAWAFLALAFMVIAAGGASAQEYSYWDSCPADTLISVTGSSFYSGQSEGDYSAPERGACYLWNILLGGTEGHTLTVVPTWEVSNLAQCEGSSMFYEVAMPNGDGSYTAVGNGTLQGMLGISEIYDDFDPGSCVRGIDPAVLNLYCPDGVVYPWPEEPTWPCCRRVVPQYFCDTGQVVAGAASITVPHALHKAYRIKVRAVDVNGATLPAGAIILVD